MLREIYLAHEISLVVRNQLQPVRISLYCTKFTWAHEINQLGLFEISFSQSELACVARNLLGHTKSAWLIRNQLQPVRISSCCMKFWAYEIILDRLKSAS